MPRNPGRQGLVRRLGATYTVVIAFRQHDAQQPYANGPDECGYFCRKTAR